MHAGKMALVGTVDKVIAAKDDRFQRFLEGRASGLDERPAA